MQGPNALGVIQPLELAASTAGSVPGTVREPSGLTRSPTPTTTPPELPPKSGEATLDRRLIKALGHPVRVRALEVLNTRVASPSELAKELGEPLGNVAYHVKILEENDAIELVRTAPVRGALEHFYRAKVRPWFDTVDLDNDAYDEIVQMLERVVERAHELRGEPAGGREKALPKELGAHVTALMMMQVRRARGGSGRNDGTG